MGVKERRAREKENMRNGILDAANQLFLEKGYDKTRMRDIAEVIEYNVATIYFYYKNKEEIFFALQNRAFSAFNQAVAQAFQGIEDPVERLTKMGRAYIRFALENPAYYDLMFIMKEPMEARKEEESWRDGEQAFHLLRHTVQGCMDAGAIPNRDPNGMALMIWSAMHGLVSLPICNRMTMFDEVDQEFLIMEAFNAFDHILTGQYRLKTGK